MALFHIFLEIIKNMKLKRILNGKVKLLQSTLEVQAYIALLRLCKAILNLSGKCHVLECNV